MSNALKTPKIRQYSKKSGHNRNPKGVSTETIALNVARTSLNQAIDRHDPITAFFPLSGDPASVPSLEVDFTLEEPVEIFTGGVYKLNEPEAVVGAGAPTIESESGSKTS
ncbi:hypothetical protein H0H93_008004 [Arthromyces matolae]|nr:hypothetical protein H0H93_008004 [Arthromyces matolae]